MDLGIAPDSLRGNGYGIRINRWTPHALSLPDAWHRGTLCPVGGVQWKHFYCGKPHKRLGTNKEVTVFDMRGFPSPSSHCRPRRIGEEDRRSQLSCIGDFLIHLSEWRVSDEHEKTL